MIQFEQASQGVLVSVKAQAAARRNGITGLHDGMLKVAVTQAPEKGKANEAILAVLADALGMARNQISLHSGATSPRKKFLFTGVSQEELEQRIASAIKAC